MLDSPATNDVVDGGAGAVDGGAGAVDGGAGAVGDGAGVVDGGAEEKAAFVFGGDAARSNLERRRERTLERILFRRFRSPFTETSELAKLMICAIIVGVITAGASITFRWLVASVHDLCFVRVPQGTVPIPLIIAAGGLTVGLLIHFFARDAHGHGVPEVINSVIMNGGKIPARVALLKMVTSSVTIGSGGSAGREGPIVQIGAALGSTVAQCLRLSEKNVTLLLACGAAAGIASTFNAPLAGVFFALEIIVGHFATRTFGFVALSAVTSSVITRQFLGDNPAFQTPGYCLVHSSEFGWFLALGLLAGLVSVVFTRSLYLIEDVFDLWHAPQFIKPALGGLLVGGIALWYPQVMGNGYDIITGALNGNLSLTLMMVLVVAKIVATALTLGSGGSGGDMAPSLVVGAVLGGVVGCLAHAYAPGSTNESGAYALVGMAAVFGASYRAPITAVLMLFELTLDYHLMLPLMAGTVVATLVAALLDRDSIYSVGFSRRGVDVLSRGGNQEDPLREMSVREVMTTDYVTVSRDITVEELAQRFNETGFHVFPVVDSRNTLLGMVSSKDLEYARLRNPSMSGKEQVRSFLATEEGYVCPDDSVALALRTMGRFGVGRLPVLDSVASRHLVGLLRRVDIATAYSKYVEKGESRATVPELKVRTASDAEFLELQMPAHSAWDGVVVEEIPIPLTAVFVALRRGSETLIPRGDCCLKSGDVAVIFCRPSGRAEIRKLLGQIAKA